MQLHHQIVHHTTRGYVYHGDVCELSINAQVFRFRVDVHDDHDMGAPWDNSDSHGPVSDWTTRDKRPGEWVLANDRGSKRYYDAQEATRIAERDGWGLGAHKQKDLLERLARPRTIRRLTGPTYVGHRFGGLMQEYRRAYETVTIPGRDPAKPLTAGEIRAEAVRRDFEFLRGWANDQWHYVGVIVTLLDADDEDGRFTPLDYSYALWGIESEAGDHYLEEVAHELMGEAARASYREQQETSYWSARGVTTH